MATHLPGFTRSPRSKKLKVAAKTIDKLGDRVRQLSQRTRGHKVERIVEEPRTSLLDWKVYVGIAEVCSLLINIDKWIGRRLRCYPWKQWGSWGNQELRRRRVPVRKAWNTSKSGQSLWLISKTPALTLSMPVKYFRNLGLPSLTEVNA